MACFKTIKLIQQIGDSFRIFSNGALYLVDTVFDSFGDVDFAFTGQQFYRAHFAHVHTYRVGSTADFRFNRCQYLCCSLGCVFIGGTAFGQQQIIGIRYAFNDLDTHVIDHLNNVFYLIRVNDILWQMIVYFSVSQITLLFTFGNEEF